MKSRMRKWRYVIEKAKHFGGKLNVTGFSYFVEKILLHFDKFDNPENSIIRNFSREPKRPDYRDMTVLKTKNNQLKYKNVST